MIVCSNCNHSNPDGATQCEACYAPLPTNTNCPNCGSSVQADATFCGQCGYNLAPASGEVTETPTLPSPPPIPASAQAEEEELSPVPSPPPVVATAASAPAGGSLPTQIQMQKGSLLHVQTQTKIELPLGLPVIHIGKPNDQIPPDIDVSGFPNSEIVSRIHSDIRVEGDAFYVEDVGSSNGTYLNHISLPPGNRHRLRTGDRLSLGKGDKVTFIFQLG